MRSQRTTMVEQLAEQVRRLEAGRWVASDEVVSTGSDVLDELLPEGGFRRGSLVEWLADSAGSGAAALALWTARQALAAGGALVVIDGDGRFYPPAAARLGIALEKLIVVRPAGEADHAWALDQVLRCRGVAAAWCAIDRPDDHTLRRWQLAAETSGVLGLLLRSRRARGEPSWAELRLGVEPIAEPQARRRVRRLRVTLLRARSGAVGRAVELEIPGQEAWPEHSRGGIHETRRVHLASELAPATTRRRARRA